MQERADIRVKDKILANGNADVQARYEKGEILPLDAENGYNSLTGVAKGSGCFKYVFRWTDETRERHTYPCS